MGNPEGTFHASDQQIINSLLKDGNTRRKGEEELFSRFQYFIKEGIRKHRLSEDESFDAYSDAVLSAIEKISNGSFQGRSTIKTWLYQIFHNKCVDLLRKKTTNKYAIHQTASLTGVLFQLSDDTRSIVQKLADKADRELLKQKLNELGSICRQLLMLSADGYTDKEIAASMEYKTADVVKTSRLRCLERLRQLYNR
ncbi:MAG TPA: sigma-70 family RNA polymerase sigma factor [Chitinophagaceae bacterium]|nr:sigma-70 family RNA polymerase sigma factor [Chitinophagaceae bacterium]